MQREPRRDDPPRDAPDSPAPGAVGGSVLFSHAPAPEASDTAGPVGAEQTGWPWFLPQDGLPRADLESSLEADADADPAAVAAVHAQIPLVHRAMRLLDRLGEGLELTADGELPLADVRALVEDLQVDLGEEELTSMWQVGAIAAPWHALVSGGWLVLSGTCIEPGDGLAPRADAGEEPEAFVLFSRALILLLLVDALTQGPDGGGLFGDPDLFAALTHTVVPGGLELPATLRVALDRGLVPTDPGGDPDMDEIQRYWRTERDLATLTACGLLRSEPSPDGQDLRVHGILEVIAEAFAALEMRGEGDGTA